MADISGLIEKVKSYDQSANLDIIKKAAEFASRAHESQFRLSGDPYITHPIAVAMILAELEQDSFTIAASLLHDVIEDRHISEEEIKKVFGETVLKLVSGATKLGQLTFASKEERQAENFRKMFIAMAEDIRIIIIKLADRLHNMQTLKFLPKEKQLDIARETREIYAPLAHRLGMWRLKWELEDLAFFYLETDKYDQIKNLVAQKRDEREKYMNDFISQVSEAISKVGINAAIRGRSKHFYSIYNKLVQKNVEFDDIYDLIAIRVVVDFVKDCYAVLGVVHSLWKPIPGRFRDFIALPKSNAYQSLHTTVMGNYGKPVEIQIRTKEMHRIAEYGVAAHWRYKEGAMGDKSFDSKLAWLRQMLEYQKEVKDAKDFLENIKIDLFMNEVFVYSPKGEVYELPVDSTPVDFAYHVHTQVGHRCVGSKVNGKIVTLDYKLKNGDIVEILTAGKDFPRLHWLNFVKTSGARAKIKQWFKKQKREENIAHGKEALEEELEKTGLDDFRELPRKEAEDMYNSHNANSAEDFYALIGNGELSAYQAAKEIRRLMEKGHLVAPLEEDLLKPAARTFQKKQTGKGIRVAGVENVMTRFSKCCFPLPGDEIAGFVTKGRGVSIHRADCPNISDPDIKEKLLKVEWEENADVAYPVNIEIEAFDRVGVIKDILAQVSETKTNIGAVEVRTRRGSSAIMDLVVDVRSLAHLKAVIDSIRKVSDVYDVYRATAEKQ